MYNIKKYAILLITLAFLLCGCGGKVETEKRVEKASELEFKTEFYTLEDVLEPGEELLQLTGEGIYYIKREENQEMLYFLELENPKESGGQVFSFEEQQSLEAFAVTEAGEMIFVVTQYMFTEEGRIDYNLASEHLLYKYDSEGTLVWKQVLSEDIGMVRGVYADRNGRILLVTSEEMLYFYDENGGKRGAMTIAGMQDIAVTPEGEVFVSRIAGNTREIIQVNPEKTKTESIPGLSGSYTLYQSGEVLAITDSTYLYAYDSEQDGELTRQLNLLEYYIDASEIFRMTMEEQGCIYILSRSSLESSDAELTILTPKTMQESELSESSSGTESLQVTDDGTASLTEDTSQELISKIELKLAAIYQPYYTQTVINFNRASSTASVSLMDFGDDAETETRIRAALLTKDAPDIIELSCGYRSDTYHNYVEQGYLVDLTPYLDNSEVISRNDFVDWVLEDYAVDGKIYALPVAMSIHTLYCSTEVLNGKTCWTIEEFLDFMEQYPNAFIREGETTNYNREMLLQTILFNGLDAFMDKEAGAAYFDGERFRNALERIKGLRITEVTESLEERVADGEVLLSTGYEPFLSNRDFVNLEWELTQGGEVTLIGYPMAEVKPGDIGQGSIGYLDAVGITATCEHPEEAWKFVERNLMKALNADSVFWPTGKAALEEKLKEETEPEYVQDDDGNYILDENGEKIERYVIINGQRICSVTPEQVAKVRSGLENAIWYEGDVDSFRSIILEEAQAYFEDIKTLDEVVRIIQNRIQLYLDEQ